MVQWSFGRGGGCRLRRMVGGVVSVAVTAAYMRGEVGIGGKAVLMVRLSQRTGAAVVVAIDSGGLGAVWGEEVSRDVVDGSAVLSVISIAVLFGSSVIGAVEAEADVERLRARRGSLEEECLGAFGGLARLDLLEERGRGAFAAES